VKTTNPFFMNILPKLYLWTRKDNMKFWTTEFSNSGIGLSTIDL